MACYSLVTITDRDESNAVDLHEVNGPVPIPLPVSNYEVQLSQMRQGASGVGARAILLGGTNESHTDWEMSCEYITPDQLAALNLKYYRQPAEPVRLTNDGGATWYLVVFANQGLQPRANDWTPERIAVQLRFHTVRRLT